VRGRSREGSKNYVSWVPADVDSGVGEAAAATSGWAETTEVLTGFEEEEGDGGGDGCAAVPVPAGAPARRSVVGAVGEGFSGVGVVAVAADAAGLGGAAGFGGAGFSGLIPPSHAGPVYMSGVSPLAFHFSSKSAAALFGVSPFPITSFHG